MFKAYKRELTDQFIELIQYDKFTYNIHSHGLGREEYELVNCR